MNKYTKRLWKKGQERKRLTDQLKQIVDEVADSIATSLSDDGMVVHINDVGTYRISKFETHLGSFTHLTVQESDGWNVFVSSCEPGESVKDCAVRAASRDSYLTFANHIAEITMAFEQENDKIIKSLQHAFAELRKAADIR